jgi:hypothetical protein
MANQRDTTLPVRPLRRKVTYALALLGLVMIFAAAAGSLVEHLRSSATSVFVRSSPYLAGIEIGQPRCSNSGQGCPEVAAWPSVSDSTSSGYVVGDTVSATTGNWSPPAGAGLAPITRYTYQWQRCHPAEARCSDIAGATQPTYTLTSGDAGFAIRAVVTATNAAGPTAQASARTPPVGGAGRNSGCTFGPATANALPAGAEPYRTERLIRATPSASRPLTALSLPLGTTTSAAVEPIRGLIYADSHGAPGALLGVSDQLVTAKPSSGAWYTLDFPSSVPLVGSRTYWIGVVAGGPPPISRLRSASIDRNTSFPVCGIQAPGGSPANASKPTVADITTPGAWSSNDTLLASSGTWSSAARAYGYQWQHCDSAGTDCTSISGATANTYVLGADQLGGRVRVVVQASSAVGSASASSTVSGAGPRTVSRVPDGPPAPRGGWSVAYADAFGAPLGTGPGHDNTVWRSRIDGDCTNNPGFNSNEMEVFNCSQAAVNSNGLQLTCEYVPHIVSGKNYSCGMVTTGGQHLSRIEREGYRMFQLMPGRGQDWAIQITAKFPPNTGEADPGWWASDPRWSWEIDMFEGFGPSAGDGGTWCNSAGGSGSISITDPTWIYHTRSRMSIRAEQALCRDAQPSPFDPSAGYHTYTTVIYPNNRVSEYIDGHIQVWDYVPAGGNSHVTGGALLGPPGGIPKTYGQLILSYALRDTVTGNPDPHFVSGSRSLSVRSIAVYENTAARGAHTRNFGLIAPGTALSR